MGRSSIGVMLVLAAVLGISGTSSAQVKYELYNEQGATAPCIGIGIGVFIAKKCESAFAKAGFVVEKDLGESGVTLGLTGDSDGVVTAVAAGSAGAQAGFAVGDVLVSVDGHPARPTPAEMVAQMSYGPRKKELHVKVLRGGAEQELVFERMAKEPPPSPKGEGMMTTERPIINWRGQFAPCIGFGPTMEVAFAYCDKHFEPFGFIRTNEFAVPGFAVDAARLDAAVVSGVDANSPAEKAGLKAGDTIVSLEGKPLAESTGANAKMLLFGKAGQVHEVVVRRGEKKEEKLKLTLGPRAKGAEKKDDKA
jgi:S1-C subfamily serine protease